jgi:ribosomal protein S24E
MMTYETKKKATSLSVMRTPFWSGRKKLRKKTYSSKTALSCKREHILLREHILVKLLILAMGGKRERESAREREM